MSKDIYRETRGQMNSSYIYTCALSLSRVRGTARFREPLAISAKATQWNLRRIRTGNDSGIGIRLGFWESERYVCVCVCVQEKKSASKFSDRLCGECCV